MRKLLSIIGAFGVAGCTAGTPTGSATSGGATIGRAHVQATEDTNAQTTGARSSGMDAAADSLKFAQAQTQELGLSSAHDNFQVLTAQVGSDGLNHVKLGQMRDGVKVFGSEVMVHSDNAFFNGLDGNVLTMEGLDLKAKLAPDVAMAKAKEDYARGAQPGMPLEYARESKELVILPLDNDTARLTWHVSFFTEAQAGMKPMLMHYFIDAHDGSLVQRFNGLHTANLEA